MKNKNDKKDSGANYLDRIPVYLPSLDWSEENGIVTLHKENKGLFNKIAQMLFKKPKISHIHLDEFGSFVWLLIDGKTDLTDLGPKVSEHFGDKAEPLYPRLAKFFQILDSYGFIGWK